MNVDAKDILGLPRTPMSITQKKKFRPQKVSQRKPHGISAKVYALRGGLGLLMPSIDVSQLKKCSLSDEKLQFKEAEGSSFLEGSYGNMPGTLPKQSNRGADQEE